MLNSLFSSPYLIATSTIVAAFMAITMIFVRMKTAQKPTSVKRIILPPIFMSSGALMFVFPEFRVSLLQVVEAISVGAIFSILLIKTTKFELKNNEVYLIPSKAFIFVLIGLLAFRLVLKTIIGSKISFGETSGMFFLLAFGMIVTWRLAMVVKYKRIQQTSFLN